MRQLTRQEIEVSKNTFLSNKNFFDQGFYLSSKPANVDKFLSNFGRGARNILLAGEIYTDERHQQLKEKMGELFGEHAEGIMLACSDQGIIRSAQYTIGSLSSGDGQDPMLIGTTKASLHLEGGTACLELSFSDIMMRELDNSTETSTYKEKFKIPGTLTIRYVYDPIRRLFGIDHVETTTSLLRDISLGKKSISDITAENLSNSNDRSLESIRLAPGKMGRLFDEEKGGVNYVSSKIDSQSMRNVLRHIAVLFQGLSLPVTSPLKNGAYTTMNEEEEAYCQALAHQEYFIRNEINSIPMPAFLQGDLPSAIQIQLDHIWGSLELVISLAKNLLFDFSEKGDPKPTPKFADALKETLELDKTDAEDPMQALLTAVSKEGDPSGCKNLDDVRRTLLNAYFSAIVAPCLTDVKTTHKCQLVGRIFERMICRMQIQLSSSDFSESKSLSQYQEKVLRDAKVEASLQEEKARLRALIENLETLGDEASSQSLDVLRAKKESSEKLLETKKKTLTDLLEKYDRKLTTLTASLLMQESMNDEVTAHVQALLGEVTHNIKKEISGLSNEDELKKSLNRLRVKSTQPYINRLIDDIERDGEKFEENSDQKKVSKDLVGMLRARATRFYSEDNYKDSDVKDFSEHFSHQIKSRQRVLDLPEKKLILGLKNFLASLTVIGFFIVVGRAVYAKINNNIYKDNAEKHLSPYLFNSTLYRNVKNAGNTAQKVLSEALPGVDYEDDAATRESDQSSTFVLAH